MEYAEAVFIVADKYAAAPAQEDRRHILTLLSVGQYLAVGAGSCLGHALGRALTRVGNCRKCARPAVPSAGFRPARAHTRPPVASPRRRPQERAITLHHRAAASSALLAPLAPRPPSALPFIVMQLLLTESRQALQANLQALSGLSLDRRASARAGGLRLCACLLGAGVVCIAQGVCAIVGGRRRCATRAAAGMGI